jgi:hypothetical protein
LFFISVADVVFFSHMCKRQVMNPDVAKVEDAADGRRQGFGCSHLRRILDNAADAVSSALSKGKQQGDYDVGAGPHWRRITWELLNSPQKAPNNK